MKRKLVVRLSIVLTCQYLIFLVGRSDTDNKLSEDSGQNFASDETNIKIEYEIQNETIIEDSKDLIFQYVSNLENERKVLSRNCVTWEESYTPKHQFTLFRCVIQLKNHSKFIFAKVS